MNSNDPGKDRSSDATVSVSVVIPTYNREVYVVKAVDSVLRQTFKDYEIIVSDDGSTDGTRQALEPYLGKIKYVYHSNAGVSAARNAGIALATGKWVAFLDSDDEWDPDCLARHMRAISQNQDVCMQIADCRNSDPLRERGSWFESNGSLKEFNGVGYLRPKEPFIFLVRHLVWPVQCSLVRREIINSGVLFDEKFRVGEEDQDFLARIALRGPVGLLNDKLMTAFRRLETTANLSKIVTANPVGYRTSYEGVYRKWDSIPELKPDERRTVRWAWSANYRATGNLLWAEGKIREARNAYWKAVITQPSSRSIGKYLLSFLKSRPTISKTGQGGQ